MNANREYDSKAFARWLLTSLPKSLDIKKENEPQHVFSELDLVESRTPYGVNLRELTSKELFPEFSLYFRKFLARNRINIAMYDSFVGVPLGATGIADRISAEYRTDVIVAKLKAIEPQKGTKQDEKISYKDHFEQNVDGKHIIPIEDVPYTGHNLDNLVWSLRKCGALVDIVMALVERKDKCYETRTGGYAFLEESGLTMIGKKHKIRCCSMLGIETLFEAALELKMPQLDDAAKKRINQYLEKNSLSEFRFDA